MIFYFSFGALSNAQRLFIYLKQNYQKKINSLFKNASLQHHHHLSHLLQITFIEKYSTIKMIKSRWLQDPRQIVLSQVSRIDSKNPQKRSGEDLKVKKQVKLPPINNQRPCRRFKTQPSQPPLRRRSHFDEIKNSLAMSQSRVLSHIKTQLPSLQQLKIVEGGLLKNIIFAGHIRIPTVHNDYHNSKTNGGYSRNKTGGIYPK